MFGHNSDNWLILQVVIRAHQINYLKKGKYRNSEHLEGSGPCLFCKCFTENITNKTMKEYRQKQ